MRKMSSAISKAFKFIDIGANLTDSMYQGIYHGSVKHSNDLDSVIKRSADQGVEKIIITGGSYDDSKEALVLAEKYPEFYSTVGCHPTRCGEFKKHGNPEIYLQNLIDLVNSNKEKIVAVGEFGLDYDRTKFCDIDTQKTYFEYQFELAESSKLPLFLHCRNSYPDFIEIIKRNRDRFSSGVVHSFTGTTEEANSCLEVGLYIGINGCSLKTQQNLETVSTIPLERLMLETDAPWCEIKNTHAGSQFVKTTFSSKKKEKWDTNCTVKGRNEPGAIIQVLEVLASQREEDIDYIADVIYKNTEQVFFNRKLS